jgi:hypothetical protein
VTYESELLDAQKLKIEGSASPLSFQTEGGGHWEKWDRYLVIDGKKAFHIGNICGTCQFIFERMDGANKSVDPKEVAEELNNGLSHLTPALDKLKLMIPDGEYQVLLQKIIPSLVTPGEPGDYFVSEQIGLWGVDTFWGLPHSPKTEYYRIADRQLPEKRAFYEFLIPTFPHNWLKQERIAEYSQRLSRGETPTAVALSVLDAKGPADWEGEKDTVEHLVLANYLVDGHHKVYAAATNARPITLVSFLAMDKGISTKEQVTEVIGSLQRTA